MYDYNHSHNSCTTSTKDHICGQRECNSYHICFTKAMNPASE